MLAMAGERYSYHFTGLRISQELWNCPFTKAMCYIALSPQYRARSHFVMVESIREQLMARAPILAMLLVNPQIHAFRVSGPRRPLHAELGTSISWSAFKVLNARIEARGDDDWPSSGMLNTDLRKTQT